MPCHKFFVNEGNRRDIIRHEDEEGCIIQGHPTTPLIKHAFLYGCAVLRLLKSMRTAARLS